MKRHERLGEARTPNGTLIALYRHDGAYLIRADGVELMSTRRHLSEDRLAEVACAPLRQAARARVLIGGLGLGFTLREALRQLREDAEVVVAELLAEVIAWNANPAYGLSADAMSDPRVRIVHDDVTEVLRTNAGGSIVYWSVGDDPKFAATLRGAGLDVRTLPVRAHDTSGPMHTLYVATPRA